MLTHSNRNPGRGCGYTVHRRVWSRILSRTGRIVIVATSAIAAFGGNAIASEVPTPLPHSALQEFTVPGQPGAIASGAEDGIWFTTSGAVDRMTPNGVLTGEFVPSTGAEPNEPAASYPQDLALGAEGDMWFTDAGTNSEHQNFIGRITPAGHIAEFAVPGGLGKNIAYAAPNAIARGADGNIWFTDIAYTTEFADAAFIGRVTPTGAIVEFPLPSGSGPNVPKAPDPRDIALGPDGNMWFTDDGSDSEGRGLIGRIAPNGAISEFPVPGASSSPGEIAAGSDGNLWFTLGSHEVGRITPAGVVTEYGINNVFAYGSLGDIAVGPEGDIWITQGNSAMVRVDPTGEVTSFSGAAAEALFPGRLALGPDGALWYDAGFERIARLEVPVVPSASSAPAVSGQAREGGALSVSPGIWTHEPTAFSYQWQLCDSTGAQCQDLAGATAPRTAVTTAEREHTLRAVVTASNIAGSASATSASTAPIEALPPVPLAPLGSEGVLASGPQPSIGAAMTWRFGFGPTYTLVKSLVVRGVPKGAWIELYCHGHGCPFSHRRLTAPVSVPSRRCRSGRCATPKPTRIGEFSVGGLFRGRHLGLGAHIVVDVVETGWIGKSFRFAIRSNRTPQTQIECLAPGTQNVAPEC